MRWSTPAGLVAFLFVLAVVLGAVAGLAVTLVGETAAMIVVGVVLVVFLGLSAYGGETADGGTPYW